MELLSKAIAVEVTQTKSIDLSYFSATGEQLIELISAQEGVEVLNISHMQGITIDILRQLIPLLLNLRRLVLLYTIPDADILTLLSESPELFYRIDSIIHFAFLHHLGKAVFPVEFSHIFNKETGDVMITSVPYFTLDQVAQALTDHLSLLKSEDHFTILTTMRNELPLLAAYASAVREPGRSWSERIVPFIPGKTLKLNEREGWFFAWSSLIAYRSSSPYRYAFAKLNKEVSEECQRRIDELRESFKLPGYLDTPQNSEGQAAGEAAGLGDDNSETAMTSSLPDELHAKEEAIKSVYADREFHIFDVNFFFQELVKEGRPAPSPEVLTTLCIFKEERRPVVVNDDSRSFKVVLGSDTRGPGTSQAYGNTRVFCHSISVVQNNHDYTAEIFSLNDIILQCEDLNDSSSSSDILTLVDPIQAQIYDYYQRSSASKSLGGIDIIYSILRRWTVMFCPLSLDLINLYFRCLATYY
jgi:hypothetical protein